MKFILLALSSLLMNSRPPGTQSESFGLVKETARIEITRFSAKFLWGAVLTSIIIYSIILLGNDLQAYIYSFSKGYLVEPIIFIGIAAVSVTALYFLFRPKIKHVKKQNPVVLEANSDSKQIDLPILVSRFAEGFMDGMRRTPGER